MNESITLFSTLNGADKEYRIQLTAKDDGFILTGYNGRRGGTMTPQPKIAVPVPYAEAKADYDALLKKQLKKGYQPGNAGANYTAPIEQGIPTGVSLHLLTQAPESDVDRFINDDAWCAQQKWDGERRPLIRRDTVFGGNKNCFRVALTVDLAKALSALPYATVLDSEQVGDRVYVFDAIEASGQCLRDIPLINRLEIMKRLVGKLGAQACVLAVETAIGTKAKRALYERLKATRQEGIVFKKLVSGYRSGYNDDQIKMPFFESCTVQVVAHHKTKRSISVQGFDKDGLPDPLGWITVPSNYPMPPVGALVDTEYLYRVKALVRTIYRGIRTDQTLASCSTVNLKYRADIGVDDVEDETDAALLAA